MISAPTQTPTMPGAVPEDLAWTSWRIRRGPSTDPRSWARQALRTRSPALPEVLARALTRDHESSVTLRARILSQGVPAGLIQASNRALALNLATAWAASAEGPQTLAAAARLFEELWAGCGPADMIYEHKLIAAQTWFLTGHHALLAEALPELNLRPVSAHYLHADLANPMATGPSDLAPATPGGKPQEEWLRLLGQPFADHQIIPPTVREASDPDEPPFNRLQVNGVRPGSTGGELVTVVMPCWRPDEGLFTSVASITGQSWGDLEILVVDDASGPEWEGTFARAQAMDPRVRIVRMERNGGSYLGREAAIGQARGAYVTFQDADDWSHPSRIEHQVAALRGSSAAMSRSDAVRALDDLTHQWLGYSPLRANASSLLVRREVFETCGAFIPVRKGADSEFAERVQTLTGPIADTHTPLAITRLRAGSLSRADFTWSWMAPERLLFRGSYRAWHRQLREERAAGSTPLVSTADLHTLPFPVPVSFVRDLPGAERTPTRYAVAYVGNFSEVGTTPGAQWLRERGTELAEGDLPVGIWSLEAPWVQQVARPELSDDWGDLLRQHPGLRPLARTEAVEVDRVVVVDPETLALVTHQECRVSARSVDLWLTPELVEPSVSGLPVDVLGLADIAAAWWGVRPRWVLAPYLDDAQRTQVLDAVPGLIPGLS